MRVDIAWQLRCVCQAVLLGGGLGVCYDLMRVIRREVPAPWLCCVLDLLFWGLCTAALFVFSHRAWNGEIRLYGAVFCLLGGWVYFRGLSPCVLALTLGAAELGRRLLGMVLTPARFGGRLLKRIGKFLKTSFLSRKKGV